MGIIPCPPSGYCVKKLERVIDFNNAIITKPPFIREEISDLDLQSCARKCLTFGCTCSAILHSSRIRSCKVLGDMIGSQSLGSVSPEEGWKFYITAKGCEPGWLQYETHCYFFGESEVTWMEAKSECEGSCSYLVEIETKEESDWLAQTFLFKDTCPSDIYLSCHAWTGGNDLTVEGRYQWSHSNKSINFTNWFDIEPYTPDKEDCIQLLMNGEWNDGTCSDKTQYICEKSDGS
ncbi:perlucin-like protein [Saccostrea cucullata]|uniref:perlucin-like protein n=1 Tax=Saccostrea cuccullata TaxID=36930 RepID=UPI002ED0F88B